MSHFSKVETKIVDKEALENALSSMGLSLEENSFCRYYYGTEWKDLVARLHGPYDVAFEKNMDGTYSINADFYGGYVEEEIGKNGSVILEKYSREKIKLEAKRKGFKVTEVDNRLKIYDSSDSSGSYLEATFDKEGNVTFKAKGFNGANCMKFKSLEDSLGKSSRRFTPEYYNRTCENSVKVYY